MVMVRVAPCPPPSLVAGRTTEELSGNHSISELRRALTPEGTYVLVGHDQFGATGGRWIGGSMGRFLKLAVTSPLVSQQLNPRTSKEGEDPMVVLQGLIEAGEITPIIDRTIRQGLDVANAVVAQVADCSTVQRRQAGQIG